MLRKDKVKLFFLQLPTDNETWLRDALKYIPREAINETFDTLDGYTAIQYAAKNNLPMVVTALLEGGADPNIQVLCRERRGVIRGQ